MTASKPEVTVSELVDKIGAKVQRLYYIYDNKVKQRCVKCGLLARNIVRQVESASLAITKEAES